MAIISDLLFLKLADLEDRPGNVSNPMAPQYTSLQKFVTASLLVQAMMIQLPHNFLQGMVLADSDHKNQGKKKEKENEREKQNDQQCRSLEPVVGTPFVTLGLAGMEGSPAHRR